MTKKSYKKQGFVVTTEFVAFEQFFLNYKKIYTKYQKKLKVDQKNSK
jgi:hypothetical protein